MASHFASEFAKIFSTTGCTIEGYDWNQPHYFDPNAECYAAETALMSELTSEAYNKFGFTVEYYIKQISTKRDKIYGEDALENIVRRFKLSVYTAEVPQSEKHYLLQGMTYTDVVHLQCSIQHFKEASVRNFLNDKPEFDEYYPKIGDLMYFPWNKTFYEIINVKTFSDGSSFLSVPITFEFILKVWKPSHEDVDIMNKNPDEMSEVNSLASLGEVFDMDLNGQKYVVADHVDKKKKVPFSTSGDILSINNSSNGLDKGLSREKSINEPIYKNSDLDDAIFNPFEN